MSRPLPFQWRFARALLRPPGLKQREDGARLVRLQDVRQILERQKSLVTLHQQTENNNHQGYQQTENNYHQGYQQTENNNDQGYQQTENNNDQDYQQTENINNQGYQQTENNNDHGYY